LTFSPDSLLLASASADKTIKLWDVKGGQEVRTLAGYNAYLRGVSFSPDGLLLASGSWDGVKLWDASRGQEGHAVRGHTHHVTSATFSPDGRLLASASGDATVKLWDPKSGREVRTFRGHTDTVWSVTFSPDGQAIASASDDKTVKLWDAKSGEEVRTLRHNSAVRNVTFSPDGLVVFGRDAFDKVFAWDRKGAKQGASKPEDLKWPSHGALSPDRRLLALPLSTRVLLVHLKPPTEKERAFREMMASPDPYWHEEQWARAEKEGRAFAAAFHGGPVLKLRQQTLVRRKNELGPDHATTLLAMWDLAKALVKLGRGAEAVPIMDECLQRAASKDFKDFDRPDLQRAAGIDFDPLGVIELRLRHFEKAKDASGCRATAEMGEKLKQSDAVSLYNAACWRAVTAAVIRSAGKSTDMKKADAEADRAMAWLEQAVSAGFRDVRHMKKDSDLDSLRNRDDFKKLVAWLESLP
jgi:hypothetical protein